MSPRRRLRAGWELFHRFSKDGGLYLSAAISFYAMLSIVPLLFFLINLLARIVHGSADLHAVVFGSIKNIYPLAGDFLSREITSMAESRGVGWLSLALFLWVGSFVFQSVEYSLNIIFSSGKKRRFVVSKLMSFGLVLLSGLTFATSFWISYLPRFLRRFDHMFTHFRAVRGMAESVMVQAAPFALTIIIFTLAYKLLPKRDIPLRLAAAGGLVAGTLWEAAKYLFAWYVGNVADLNIFGSLSSMILFMLWVYYSSAILLLVAEGMRMRLDGGGRG